MIWSGILALLGWAVTATAQGRLGIGDQSACSPANTFAQYIGCYFDGLNGAKAGFPFRLINAGTDPKSYPGYGGTANLTVDICTTACRAHGFRLSMLYAAVECWCSPQIPYPLPPLSADTSGGNGAYGGTSPGTASAGSNCNRQCPANNTQICGGNSYGSVYADLSFVNDTSPATIGAAANFGYFGCYTNSGGGPGFIQIHSPTLESCQSYCGNLGYAFAVRNNVDSPPTLLNQPNNCQCGPSIQAGLQVAESGFKVNTLSTRTRGSKVVIFRGNLAVLIDGDLINALKLINVIHNYIIGLELDFNNLDHLFLFYSIPHFNIYRLFYLFPHFFHYLRVFDILPHINYHYLFYLDLFYLLPHHYPRTTRCRSDC
ncbi:MAG: hypothetical protein Q9169_005551 [Polycauliona sp. 2 TL-2023]